MTTSQTTPRNVLQEVSNVDINAAFAECRAVVEAISTSGYTLMVNFSIIGYEHFECTFHDDWKEQYDAGNYLLYDPVFKWALENHGSIRWSEIDLPDSRHILVKSREYGLRYGAAISATTGKRKSMVFMSRHDREISDQELAEAKSVADRFFKSILPPPELTAKELKILKMLIQEELSYAEISERLNISLSGIKSRFRRIREKYDCKSTAALCYRAKELNLLGIDAPIGRDSDT